MDAVEAKVKSVIQEQTGVDEAKLTSEAKFVTDLGVDSLNLVELALALEEEFDIDIPDEDAEKIKTVGECVAYIEAHTKSNYSPAQ
jgi:acyl carrier protein